MECLGQARTIARRRSVVNPAAVPWAADLAEALVAVGDHEQARAVVAEARGAAHRLGRSGVALSLLRAESADLPSAAAALAAWHEAAALFRTADVRPWLDQAHTELHRVTCGWSAAPGAAASAGGRSVPGGSGARRRGRLRGRPRRRALARTNHPPRCPPGGCTR